MRVATQRLNRDVRLGRLWRARSRQAFYHPVRVLAVAAPTTKVEPLHCSSAVDAQAIQSGSTFAAGLVPEPRAPGQGVDVTVGYKAFTPTSQALSGSGAPPRAVTVRLDVSAGSFWNHGAAHHGQSTLSPTTWSL